MLSDCLSCRPASYYHRRAIRESLTTEGLRRIALALVEELEDRNAQIRELGEIPRRVYNPRMIGPDGVIVEDERQIEFLGGY